MKINWIANYPKSGSTWVNILLQSYATGKTDINDLNVVVFDNKVESIEGLEGLSLLQSCRHYVLAKIVHGWNENAPKDEEHLFPLLIRTHNPRIHLDKVELIPSYMMGKAIYLVRDPRAVVVSFARHIGTDIDTAILLMNHRYYGGKEKNGPVKTLYSTWTINVESWLRDDTTVIKYEDLKVNPATNFRLILETFGIPVYENKLNWAIESSSLNKLKQQEDEKGFNFSHNRKERFFGGSPDWRDVLTDKQKNKIVSDHGETMEKLGYL